VGLDLEVEPPEPAPKPPPDPEPSPPPSSWWWDDLLGATAEPDVLGDAAVAVCVAGAVAAGRVVETTGAGAATETTAGTVIGADRLTDVDEVTVSLVCSSRVVVAGAVACPGFGRDRTCTGGGGTRPLATESGSPASPIFCPASWLASHATAAVATMPSRPPATQSKVRLLTLR
jgi:hypothetical protein